MNANEMLVRRSLDLNSSNQAQNISCDKNTSLSLLLSDRTRRRRTDTSTNSFLAKNKTQSLPSDTDLGGRCKFFIRVRERSGLNVISHIAKLLFAKHVDGTSKGVRRIVRER